MKLLISIFLLVATLLAGNIYKPDFSYTASGSVVDLIIDDNKLYASTNASSVDIFDINTHKLLQKIKVSKIKNFLGDTIDSKIYSVDILNENILILSLGESGARRVHIYKNKKLEVVLPSSKKMYIAKAKFLDNDNILLGLLSNDIISYNIKTKKENWVVQASQSKFSDFALNDDKSKVVIADESGNLHILDTKNGKNITTLSGKNLDNVFRVDWKKDTIATAGQDRRTVVYNMIFNSSYYKSSSFMIYTVGVSPDATIVAYASDENNNATLFNTNTKTTIGVFGGNKMTLTNIVFKNEKELFIACDDSTINYYKIK
jgi:outer membrane protein assembly factor BamB